MGQRHSGREGTSVHGPGGWVSPHYAVGKAHEWHTLCARVCRAHTACSDERGVGRGGGGGGRGSLRGKGYVRS